MAEHTQAAEPEPLDPELQGYLDAYLADTTITPASIEHALARVHARGDGGSALGSVGGAKIVAAVVLAVAVAVAVAASLIVANEPLSPPIVPTSTVPTPTVAAPVITPDPAPTDPAPADPSPPDAPAAAVASPPRSLAAPSRRPSAREVEKKRADEAKPATTARGDTLAAELELLLQARHALRAGAPSKALAVVRRHAAAYPNSDLAEERGATEVMALCRLGELTVARRKADAFLRAFPGSAFQAGLVEGCDPPSPRED